MSTNDFLKKDNVSLLWDVILDEDIIKTHSRESISKTEQVFYNNIQGFYENEKNKNNTLIEMNKKYIMLILNYMNTNFKPLSKIKIYEGDLENDKAELLKKDLITFEEIQNDKRSQFEKDLTIKQQEFTNAMSQDVPEIPNFKDQLDEPLTEIELAIKKMTEQRNYDIEQINKNFSQNTNANWLKPEETSIKNEKLQKPKQISWADENVKTDENVKINFEEKIEKNIQDFNFVEEIKERKVEETQFLENNIFKKLKKIDLENENNLENRVSKLENIINKLSEKIDFLINQHITRSMV